MLRLHFIPIFLSLLVGLFLALLLWAGLYLRSPELGARGSRQQGNLFLGLLVLAVFSLGIFLGVVFLGMR